MRQPQCNHKDIKCPSMDTDGRCLLRNPSQCSVHLIPDEPPADVRKAVFNILTDHDNVDVMAQALYFGDEPHLDPIINAINEVYQARIRKLEDESDARRVMILEITNQAIEQHDQAEAKIKEVREEERERIKDYVLATHQEFLDLKTHPIYGSGYDFVQGMMMHIAGILKEIAVSIGNDEMVITRDERNEQIYPVLKSGIRRKQ